MTNLTKRSWSFRSKPDKKNDVKNPILSSNEFVKIHSYFDILNYKSQIIVLELVKFAIFDLISLKQILNLIIISLTYYEGPATGGQFQSFVFCKIQNTKHRQFWDFQKLWKYCVIIKFLFSQKNHTDSIFNQKFFYEFRMQGPVLLIIIEKSQ